VRTINIQFRAPAEARIDMLKKKLGLSTDLELLQSALAFYDAMLTSHPKVLKDERRRLKARKEAEEAEVEDE
jgi:hypothetical protein